MSQKDLQLKPFSNFEEATREVLTYLHERFGFSLWMMTRVEDDDWIVLQSEDHGYNVNEGKVFRWADSFCSRMVRGEGPKIAPKVSDVPAYMQAPIGQQVPIGAYIGMPVLRGDGSLFGTLCAIDPDPQNESILAEQPIIELLARLLETVLEYDLRASEQARFLERAQFEALTDELTGLFNRRGWDRYVAGEEARARRFGYPACVIVIDLDGLKEVNDNLGHEHGDKLICDTAKCISNAVRKSDLVARLGGDEFAVLGIETDATGAEELTQKISNKLASEGIKASLGQAMRDPNRGLLDAIAAADKAMYTAKTKNKSIK